MESELERKKTQIESNVLEIINYLEKTKELRENAREITQITENLEEFLA